MKNIFYNLFFMAIALASCSKHTSNYAEAISSFVQTDKKGLWTDLKFQIVEMGTPINITVGDSIRILTDAFEAGKSKKLDFVNENIERNRKSLEKEKSAVMRKFYKNYIVKQQKIIDSLTVMTVNLPQSYNTKQINDVLAKVIICKFSIVNPLFNTKQEETRAFILNAKGDKCFRCMSDN